MLQRILEARIFVCPVCVTKMSYNDVFCREDGELFCSDACAYTEIQTSIYKLNKEWRTTELVEYKGEEYPKNRDAYTVMDPKKVIEAFQCYICGENHSKIKGRVWHAETPSAYFVLHEQCAQELFIFLSGATPQKEFQMVSIVYCAIVEVDDKDKATKILVPPTPILETGKGQDAKTQFIASNAELLTDNANAKIVQNFTHYES
jgi:predicted RNA-binding Zn-ribbon protein involved in translation (DUF1610 family)